jgi:cell division protein YceG involved in septum cleavage
VIVASIDDENNIYNTRKRKGLTPTPIANPSVDTIKSVLQFQKNINLYYLHDADGNIWTAETVE